MFTFKVKTNMLPFYSRQEYLALRGHVQVSDRWGFDSTMMATVMLTIGARLYKKREGAVFYIKICSGNIVGSECTFIKNDSLSDIITKVTYCTPKEKNAIYILSAVMPADDAQTISEYFDENPNVERLKNVQDFFASKGIRAIFVRETATNRALAIFSGFDIKTYHAVQAFIPVLLPNYFTGDDALTETEKALFDSMMHHRYLAYITAANALTESLDIAKDIVRRQILSLNQDYVNRRISEAQQHLGIAIRQLNDWNTNYQHLMNTYREAQDRLVAASNAEQINMEPVADLFETMKCLVFRECGNSKLTFDVHKPLDMWDPEVFDTHIRNKSDSNFFYYRTGNSLFDDNRELFLRSVFGEKPVYKIELASTFQLNLLHCNVTPGYAETVSNAIGNPHHHHYHCLGNYAPEIQNRLRANDIVGAIDQCIGTTGCVNLAEKPTMENFLSDLAHTHQKCVIRMSDGTRFTPMEAINELLKENNDGAEHQGD